MVPGKKIYKQFITMTRAGMECTILEGKKKTNQHTCLPVLQLGNAVGKTDCARSLILWNSMASCLEKWQRSFIHSSPSLKSGCAKCQCTQSSVSSEMPC